jgi:hypothetical protein
MVVVSGFAYSQDNPGNNSKLTFHSSFAFALINGSASTSFNLQTVHGFSFNKSFTGIGAGIDYYTFRSLPLFLQLRQEFGKGKKRFIVYGDGGRNFQWLTDKSKEQVWSSRVEYKGGWYYDAGIGYKLALKDKALLLTTGYSYKEIKKNVIFTNCIMGGQCIDDVERYQYRMRRISVRASFQF